MSKRGFKMAFSNKVVSLPKRFDEINFTMFNETRFDSTIGN